MDIDFLRHDDIHVAYTVPQGAGPNVLWVAPWVLPIELIEEIGMMRDLYVRSGSYSRWATYDAPGTGSSDTISFDPPPGLGFWTDVLGSVLDHLSWDRAALLGVGFAASVAVSYAVRRPDRITKMVLINPFLGNDLDDASIDLASRWFEHASSSEEWLQVNAPTLAQDPEVARHWSRMTRQAIRPADRAAIWGMSLSLDARDVAPRVDCPVLVIGTRAAVPQQARLTAELIPDAELIESETPDFVAATPEDVEAWSTAIERFLTGEASPVRLDRTLTTVLFTDIVSSTQQALERGDKRWIDVLERHDRIARDTVHRFGGHVVKSTGDGALATIPSPARAVRCASTIVEAVRGLGLELRAGLHAGEIEVRGDDIGGTAVNLARRVCDSAGPGEIRVSEAVVHVVAGSGLEFTALGPHELKGLPGEWRLFRVLD